MIVRIGVSRSSVSGTSKVASAICRIHAVRLPGVTSLDLRLGKEFRIQRARLNVDLDLFNALNSATVLGRQYNQRLTTYNNVLEIMNPRILRLGLRVGF